MLNKICFLVVVILVTFFVNWYDKHDVPTKVSLSETCSIDHINGSINSGPLFILNSSSKIEFYGWFADGLNGRLPSYVTIELIDSKGIVASVLKTTGNVNRPDVAAALNSLNVNNAGFNSESSAIKIVPGIYDILLVGLYDDQLIVCRTNKKLQIK